MDTGEAHLRKRSVPFRYAIKDFTMIVRQGTSHGLDVLPESIQAVQFNPKGSPETELFACKSEVEARSP